MMNNNFLILDCFVDEPACLGVPPFISPYPRYIYGALLDADLDENNITYQTIDALRKNHYQLDQFYSHVLLIGGAVVPGKYLGEKIGTLTEIIKIITQNPGQQFLTGGHINDVLPEYPNAIHINGDIEKYTYNLVKGQIRDENRTTIEIARWSKLGARMIARHPNFPDIICEIETARGCPREKHCSFCSEGLYQSVDFRETSHIIDEIDELMSSGASRFRLGRQADIIQYQSRMNTFIEGFSKPEPAAVTELFSELKKRKDTGQITTLNIDNANPGSIFYYPELSSQILETICAAITPGDTLALGFESFDEKVVVQNNLKVSSQQAIEVIKRINQAGNKRINGIPILLPGINLIHGLKGEDIHTFKKNYETLVKMKEKDLLIKRINIRKLQPFPGTEMFNVTQKISGKINNRFEFYRNKIRHDIDNYMLKKIYPAGTILEDVQVLETRSGYSYGKQIASYPITLKYPLLLEYKKKYNSIIIGHGERSLNALPLPIELNTIGKPALERIPGISKKMASTIIINRPFKTIDDAATLLKDVNTSIKNHIIIT